MKTKQKPKKTSDSRVIAFVKKHYLWIFLFLFFCAHFFLRFHQLTERASWGWDQVDNAWNAQKILINNEYPLLGMPAKGNSGFNIGPAYYYLAAIFYLFTDMHPIASPIFAGVVSIATFFVLFYVTRQLFSTPVALIAVAIHTFSIYTINYDRVQWPVNFIVLISALIFYSLYKILLGSPKYFFLLSFMLGFSLHIHFTSVFYFILIFLSLPIIPRDKDTIKYAFLSSPVFLVWVIPFFLTPRGGSMTDSLARYVHTSYHGIHLRRILQIARDGFIEFQGIIPFSFMKYISILFLPVFLLVYLFKSHSREKILFSYLCTLWFLVPWLVFATYSGEITNYYFSMTRPLAVIILAYLTYKAITFRWYIGAGVVLFWFIFAVYNMQLYGKEPENEFAMREHIARERINKGNPIEYYINVPEAYWHWYLKDYKKIHE